MQMAPEMATEAAASASRRPAALDFVAAVLLLATVVLHVVAMALTYFVATGSLISQPDQAALYSVLAAAWALALGIGLTGPHRTPVAAAVAAGVAVTELGFRVADLGVALHLGTASVGSGLWLMEAAWVVGAAGAVAAVLAARSRHDAKVPVVAAEEQVASAQIDIDWAAPDPLAPLAPEAVPYPQLSDHGLIRSVVPESDEDPHERMAWTVLVVVLAVAVAGAFLPAWDHAVAVSTTTGQSVTRSLGNAFSGPWQQVVGTVISAAALLVVPVVAIRMRRKAAGAALAIGSLLVLASQFVSAVVQVDEAVSPNDFGISPSQVHSLGLDLSLTLTGWFTVDALAAYALFATVMVWATLRLDHESSPGTVPSAPDRRSEAMPSAS